MATPNYEIDYNDERLVEITDKEKAALTDSEKTYTDAINASKNAYDSAINKLEESKKEQEKNVNENTEFAIQKIEQEKEQTRKDYLKEQSGAYVDWQKESNKYGANAEQMAAYGMGGSGYSESSMVKYYTSYQNRVATARESVEKAYLNYRNQMREAELQNSSLLAEIARDTLQQQLTYSIQAFQYQNTLLIEKANKALEIQNMYKSQYMSMLNQINAENSLAEQVRQYNETLAFQKDQAKKDQAYKNAALQLERDKFAYEKQQDAEASALNTKSPGGGDGENSSSENSSKTIGIKPASAANKSAISSTNKSDAIAYLSALIASGATKDKIANEISLALRENAITKEQATELRRRFTPIGLQY